MARVLEWFSGASEAKIHALRVVTFAYAAVFAVEGVGLWMQKRWAEWLTVIATSLLIPLEAFELVRNPSVLKASGLAVNFVIVVYLVRVVR